MNALKVITIAAVAACGSASPLFYNGLNYHHGYTSTSPVAYSSAVAVAAVAPTAVAPAYNSYVASYSPVAYSGVAAPAYNNYAAPYTPIQSQYHSQDELGQYSFGYSSCPSNRAETRDAYGNVRGAYTYIDSNGETQTQHYVADAFGFRVSGSNLPVGPSSPALAALEPVQDTPEVAAAKIEFQAAYDAAAAAADAAPDH